MRRIRKVLPLLFAATLIAGALALVGGLPSAAPKCTGGVNDKALCHAQEQLGRKCSWKPKKSKDIDCARIAHDAYRKAGLGDGYLSPSASYDRGVKQGWTVPVADREPGDLLFLDSQGQGVDRVAIYAGTGQMILATGGPSSTEPETITLTELTPARVKLLAESAVRPVVASTEPDQVQTYDAMAMEETANPCMEPDGTDPTTPDGGTTTTTTTTNGPAPSAEGPDADSPTDPDSPDADSPPESDSPEAESEPAPDGDGTGTETDAPEADGDTDSPDGAPDGDTDCPTTDEEPTTDPADDCLDTDVVDNRIVIIDPSNVDKKPGVVEPAIAGRDGVGANTEEEPCDRP